MKRSETDLQSSDATELVSSGVHLVVRVPRITRVNRISFDTVRVHNESIAALGKVSVAKFGNPGTSARCDRLRTQIASGLETLLILVTKHGGHFVGYKSRLASVHYGKADQMILATAPAYYSDLEEQAKLWFTVIDPFELIDIEQLSLASTRRPLLEVMRECRTASLLVEMNG